MNQLIGYLSEGEQLKGSLTIPQQLGGSTLGTKTITENDTYYAEDDGLDGYSEVTVNVSGGGGGTLETITKTYTPSTSQQTDTITPGVGYDGIAEVDVTVNAMPTGTEGTPTATKGAVSNHSVAVTPSVTNQAGYIAGGTKTGTPVMVQASELVSGTKQITQNGTGIDVTDYEDVDVNVPNSYTAADEGKVVSNGALVAQISDTVTENDTYDTTLINSLTVNVSGGIGVDWDDIAQRTYTGLSVVLPTATKIMANAFYNAGIISIEGPEVTEVEGSAVAYNTALTHIRFPKLKTCTNYSFQRNTSASMEPIVLPRLTTVGTYVFERVNATLDFTDLATIVASFLRNWYGSVLILRKSDSVCALANINGFQASPFASGGTGGTLYVPQDLISSYQSASNWSTILGYANNQIKSIESTHTDPTAPIDLTLYYADGTPISA